MRKDNPEAVDDSCKENEERVRRDAAKYIPGMTPRKKSSKLSQKWHVQPTLIPTASGDRKMHLQERLKKNNKRAYDTEVFGLQNAKETG